MRYALKVVFAGFLIVVIFWALDNSEPGKYDKNNKQPSSIQSMEITSFSFEHNGRFPTQFTCDGPDKNPDLNISKVPENAKSLVLLMDDPDAPAGNWDHWTLWNIDPATERIEQDSVPTGAVQGRTTFGHNEYGGPCPHGGEHRYFFKLYALDTMLDLPETSTKADVEKAMEGHVLEEAVIVGLYSRT